MFLSVFCCFCFAEISGLSTLESVGQLDGTPVTLRLRYLMKKCCLKNDNCVSKRELK